jgi:hypothetical protein
VTSETNIDWKHNENNFNDFNVQALIPHMVSTQGPKVAVADINKDGLDDFFVCGARDQPGALFVQHTNGTFRPEQQALFAEDSTSEDVNALFFDADVDGDPDLYVACGGNEFWGHEKVLQDRLYINNGGGKFIKSNGLPQFYGNSSVAAAADFDRDGDMDLFIGGRVTSKRYGDIPTSYLLINDGKGKFSIANDHTADGLHNIGMVTDAVWSDKNMDGWPDLIIVGEWMPITVFLNNKGKLENKTREEGLEKTSGLWMSIKAEDIDNNGFPDLLIGNWGENSKLNASGAYPAELYVGDIDGNGSFDQLLAIARNGKYYTFLGKEDLEKQFPSIIRKQFESYSQMAGLTVNEIFGARLKAMKRLTANTLSTSVLWNSGKMYKMERLPYQIQWSPVFAWAVADFNDDGKKDIIGAGNFYGVIPYEGRYDAGHGQLLSHKSTDWYVASSLSCGMKLDGEIRSIQAFRTVNNKWAYLVGRNNDKLKVFQSKGR